MEASLVMFKADGTRKDIPIIKARTVVGRTGKCDLRIPISSVSRQHCELRLENNQLKINDLGSSNGTFRNNTRISQETLLQPGDEIVIGPVIFVVVIDGKPVHIDPVRTVLDRNRDSMQKSTPADNSSTTVEPQRIVFDTSAKPTAPEVKANYSAARATSLDDPINALEAMAAEVERGKRPDTPIPSPATTNKPVEAPTPIVSDDQDTLKPIEVADDIDDIIMPILNAKDSDNDNDDDDDDIPFLVEDDDDNKH